MAKAIIHLNHIAHNVQRLRRYVQPTTTIMVALKANAYGHGAVPLAKYLQGHGIDWFAVATPEEALELRAAGISSHILLLTPVDSQIYASSVIVKLIEADIRLTIVSELQWQDLQHIAQKVRGCTIHVHLKVDTGLGRLGQPTEDAMTLATCIMRQDSTVLEGVWTHFATADEVDTAYTVQQLEAFSSFLGSLKRAGIEVPLRHCANSAATIMYPESHFDMVRPGIAVYGYTPSAHVARVESELLPVMEVRAPVTFVKQIPEGQSISYGRLWTSETPTKIASLRIGYGDGYPRALSNQVWVAFKGQNFPLRGRVCMDQIMVDVGNQTIAVGDEVTVLAGNAPTAEMLASMSARSHYEILCNIGRRVNREYID